MSSNIHSASQEEVLEKAIQKAIDGGWRHVGWELILNGNPALKWTSDNWDDYLKDDTYKSLIFNHDFAKALWGTEYTKGDKLTYQRPKWQVNLMRMVIADDPIKYLGENI